MIVKSKRKESWFLTPCLLVFNFLLFVISILTAYFYNDYKILIFAYGMAVNFVYILERS